MLSTSAVFDFSNEIFRGENKRRKNNDHNRSRRDFIHTILKKLIEFEKKIDRISTR